MLVSLFISTFMFTETRYDFGQGNKLSVISKAGVIMSAKCRRLGKLVPDLGSKDAFYQLQAWRKSFGNREPKVIREWN